MKAALQFKKDLFEKAICSSCRRIVQMRLLLTSILVFVFVASFSQKASVLLSRFDSCQVTPPPQQTTLAIRAAGTAPMVRVAYVIPSNRQPQPNGVSNLQHAIKLGQQFFKDQMEQNGFGPKTFIFETEGDGVTPLIHVVHVSETDDYLRGDLWGRVQAAARNAGISLWAPGEVWVVIPETHLMFADGSVVGGETLGAGFGSGNSGGVAMISSIALPLYQPAMITDDSPYDGKVLPELGPYPMKQGVTFVSFEGPTFSSVASSWLGALWHETGHAFGLGHDFRNDDNFHGNLMGNGLRGMRGSLFPEKYPQDYTRLEYWTALFFNVNHFFNSDKIVTNSPTVSHDIHGSVTPQQGLVQLPFQASDPDGLSFAYVVFGGDMAAEMLLEGTTANPTFAVPYFRQGDINRYIIFTVDKQGNKTNTEVEFTVPGGNNQAPIPFIKITPPVPGQNQTIVLDASLSSDVDHDQSSLLVAWDVDNDGQFDTQPSTNKMVQYQYKNPGNYLIRLKVTDPAGGETISTPVSIKIPGEENIICQADVTLTSQAEVDAFSCTEVTGNLTISGNDISNLNALSSLRKVGGNLSISDNPNLETIDLPDLHIGDISVRSLSISNNANLKSISGFNNTQLASSIYIGGNPKLVSISGFDSLQQVIVDLGGGFVIEQNDALTSVQAFAALSTTPNFRILNNPALLALDGFPALTQVIGEFQISNNESLKTINGFNKLTGISGYPRLYPNSALLIQNNASLEALEGLSSLKSISAPDQYPAHGVVTVRVAENPKLAQCCSLKPLLDALISGGALSPFVRIDISGNGGGCTQQDILNCEKICKSDVTLTSQAEVDAFSCTDVTGNLTISGNDITNLNALSSLKKVGGNLSISDNPNLETIDLPDLQIGDISSRSLSISNNANLKSISGFNNTQLASSIHIGGNPKLVSISGFDSLRQVLADFGTGFVIGQNDALTSLPAFGALITAQDLRIVNNPKLLALDGFPSLTNVYGEFQISNNESLKTISGFNKLMSISGVPRIILTSALLIENNASLETLDGLSSLKSISSPEQGIPPAHGSVTVRVTENPKLTQCCSLRPLLEALNSGGSLPPWVNINITENGCDCTPSGILECGSQKVSYFTIVDIRNGSQVLSFVSDSVVLDIANPDFKYWVIQANTSPKEVGSVAFKYDHKIRHTENAFPYQFSLPTHLKLGIHTVTADVYSEANRKGVKGIGRTATLVIINPAMVTSFEVVDTSGKVLMPLTDGSTIDLQNPTFSLISIRANTTPPVVYSVKFWLNFQFYKLEKNPPYALNGDENGKYVPWAPNPGDYVIKAIPYVKAGRKQYIGKALEVHFKVIQSQETSIVGYDIVDTSGKFIRKLNEGDVLNPRELKCHGWTIVANAIGKVGSVKFELNNCFFNIQNASPYTLTGDNNGKYFNPWAAAPGHYTIKAIPYLGANATGSVGRSLTVNFIVTDKNKTATHRIADSDGGENNEEPDNVILKVYPVPVSHELHVKMSDSFAKDAILTIRNIQGLIVYQDSYSRSENISTTDWRAGVYFLQVVGDSGIQSVKFVKE